MKKYNILSYITTLLLSVCSCDIIPAEEIIEDAAKEFYKKYDIASKVRCLKNNSSIMVSLSTRAMFISFYVYYLTANIVGGRKSNIKRIKLSDFENTK